MGEGIRFYRTVASGLVLLLLGLSVDLYAETEPLRAGRVVATETANAITYIHARDPSGRKFWVMTATCVVGMGGQIEVLSGYHFERIRSETLDKTMKDVYSARLLRINGQVVRGLSAHGLPRGCVDLE